MDCHSLLLAIVLVVCTEKTSGQTQVRLYSPRPVEGGGERGLLEANIGGKWRKVCSPPSPRLTKTSLVVKTACKDLGYDVVASLQVGGTPGGLTDSFVTYSSCQAGGSLANCIPATADGTSAVCHRQRLWLWLTCSQKSVVSDPSTVNCDIQNPDHALPTGRDLTITIKDGKSCHVNLKINEPDDVILVKPLDWPPGFGCDSTTGKGRLQFSVTNNKPCEEGKPCDATHSICSSRTRKAAKNVSNIKITYNLPGAGLPVENFRLLVSARKTLTCHVNQTDIVMLKSDIVFNEIGMSDPHADISAYVGPRTSSSECDIHPDDESDVIQISLGLDKCGIKFEPARPRSSEYYETHVIFSQVFTLKPPPATPSTVIDRIRRTKIAFRCNNEDWITDSQSFEVKQ